MLWNNSFDWLILFLRLFNPYEIIGRKLNKYTSYKIIYINSYEKRSQQTGREVSETTVAIFLLGGVALRYGSPQCPAFYNFSKVCLFLFPIIHVLTANYTLLLGRLFTVFKLSNPFYYMPYNFPFSLYVNVSVLFPFFPNLRRFSYIQSI